MKQERAIAVVVWLALSYLLVKAALVAATLYPVYEASSVAL